MTQRTALRVLLAFMFQGQGNAVAAYWLLPRKWKEGRLTAFDVITRRNLRKYYLPLCLDRLRPNFTFYKVCEGNVPLGPTTGRTYRWSRTLDFTRF